MRKLIQIILSLKADRFKKETKEAGTVFKRFAGTIKGGVALGSLALQGLESALNLAVMGIRALIGVVRGLKEQFIDAAIAVERQGRIFEALTGSGKQSADMMAFLEETSLKYGVALDGLSISAQQVAVSLRATNGEIDPAAFEELTLSIVKLSALRPDVSMDLWGRAISGLLAGDLTTMTRALDVNISSLTGFSEEAQKFINQGKAAQEEGLGAVTRLGEGIAGDPGGALQFFRELLDMVGATDETLAASVTTTDLVTERVAALKRELGEELLPAYEALLAMALDFYDENQEGISELIDDVGVLADKFATMLGEGGFSNFLADMQTVGDIFRGIVVWLDTANTSAKQLGFVLVWAADQFRFKLGRTIAGMIEFLNTPFIRKALGISDKDMSNLAASPLFDPEKTAEELMAGSQMPSPGSADGDSLLGGIVDRTAAAGANVRTGGLSGALGGAESTEDFMKIILEIDEEANLNLKAYIKSKARSEAQVAVEEAWEDFSEGVGASGGGSSSGKKEVL